MRGYNFQMPAAQNSEIFNINNFGGVNLSVTPTQIKDNESPDMLNFMLDEVGALEKRTGYKRVFDTSLGSGKINGIFQFRKQDGTAENLLAHGTKLYRWEEGKQPAVVYDGLADHDVNTFDMNGNLYILDGAHYLVYDGTTVKNVEDDAYVPTLVNAAGEMVEQWNLLGKAFKQSFTADGTTKEYTLLYDNLDATPVKVWYLGNEKVEGTDFTVDRVKGKVTFNTALAKSYDADDIVIQAYKTVPGLADRIKKCTLSVLYGGDNDTRVILSGNSDSKSVIFRSGVYDPSYFPENWYQAVGNTNEAVTGFSIQYDTCIIEKENSKWLMTFELSENGEPRYPLRPLNNTVGCIASKSIQLIENNPVMLSRAGVYMLVQSNVRNEKNVEILSEKVNKKLLKEPKLDKAVSIDYENKYILAINNNAYVLDYRQMVWYLWNNIKANCFIEIDGFLYFGGEGMLYRFMKKEELNPYLDDGKAIECYWKSKPFGMGAAERNKLIDKIFVTLSPNKHTSANFYYVTESIGMPKNKNYMPDYSKVDYAHMSYNDRIFDAKSEIIETARVELVNYEQMTYRFFSYNALEYPTEFAMKVKAKKIVYYQIVIQNIKRNEGLGVQGIVIKYSLQSYRK